VTGYSQISPEFEQCRDYFGSFSEMGTLAWVWSFSSWSSAWGSETWSLCPVFFTHSSALEINNWPGKSVVFYVKETHFFSGGRAIVPMVRKEAWRVVRKRICVVERAKRDTSAFPSARPRSNKRFWTGLLGVIDWICFTAFLVRWWTSPLVGTIWFCISE